MGVLRLQPFSTRWPGELREKGRPRAFQPSESRVTIRPPRRV